MTAIDSAGARSRVQQVAALVSEPFVVLGLVHLTVLGWRLPLFDRLPGWVFTTHATPVRTLWWAVLAVLPGVSLGLSWRLRRRPWVALLLLVLGGTAFQQALAWSEGRGLDGMRERILRSGHAEFADAAVSQRSLWMVASHYEQKVQGGELGRYAHSKPPGTLLTYMATERLSRMFAHGKTVEARRSALNSAAAILWPFVGYLVLVPLFVVVRRLTNPGTALLTCASYVVVPSVALITLHTDQFLFPLLAVTTVWAGQEAALRRSRVAAFGTGAALWLAGFFTFPLLLTGALVGAVMGSTLLQGEEPGEPSALRQWSGLMVAVALGVVTGALVFRLALGYDALARFADARAFNVAWKGWDGGAFETLYFAWMNLLEWSLWAGVPIVLLACARVGRAVRQVAAAQWQGGVALALSFALVVGYVAFFGQSKGETARLWLFLVPFASALAAEELAVRWSDVPLATVVFLALQWAAVVLTKTGQDFY